MLVLLAVVLAALTKTGMVGVPGAIHTDMAAAALPDRLDVDLIGLRQTQRQLVAMDLHLHGVSHGGQLYHRYLCTGDHAHIQKVLPQRTLTVHPANHGAFTCL